MVIASRIFEEVTVEFDLTLSIPKTKLLVAGANFTANVVAPLELGGGSVEVAKEFKYFRSLIEACGGVLGEVNCRITQASKFLVNVFLAWDLGLETKRLVYRSVVLARVLGVLLYGAESWAPTQVTVRKLESFHCHCVRSIKGI